MSSELKEFTVMLMILVSVGLMSKVVVEHRAAQAQGISR